MTIDIIHHAELSLELAAGRGAWLAVRDKESGDGVDVRLESPEAMLELSAQLSAAAFELLNIPND